MAKTTIKNSDTTKNINDKKYTIFDILDVLQGPRTPWHDLPDEMKKQYSSFMINRFISSVEMYLPIVAKLSEIKQLTDEQHYTILCNTLATKHWFTYKTYKKEKTDKDTELLLFAISKEYEIGRREAKTYINNLTETVKDKLRSKWAELYNSLN